MAGRTHSGVPLPLTPAPMQRLLAQLGLGTGQARRYRTRSGDADEDVESSGMARAVFDDDLAAVAQLLLLGVDPNAPDRGQRPLLLALLRSERPDVVELLLAAGADPCSGDGHGHGLTCLHWLAQRRGDAAVLTPLAVLMARCGADLEARESLYGAAPLAWSGWHGCPGAAAALLTAGADVRSTDAFTGTAHHWAVMNGHEETALLLHAALTARSASPERPVARASAEEVAQVRRALQRKHGVALEQDVRGDVAVAVRLLAASCEEHTGQHMPALVREVLADVLMRDGRFALWPPATRPRV